LSVLAALLAAPVPQALKAWLDRRALKAAPQPESLAQLALPVRLARKVLSDRQARKAAPMNSSRARLALAAKQARKARSERRVRKAPLGRPPTGPYTGISVSVTTARTFRLLG
jgi:hypothetical protein